MKPAPTMASVTTSGAGSRAEVARLDPVVHILEVAHEFDHRARAPAEELLPLLRGRLARRAPDASALLEDRPERPRCRQEDGIDDRERARPQLGQLRDEVANALHVT